MVTERAAISQKVATQQPLTLFNPTFKKFSVPFLFSTRT